MKLADEKYRTFSASLLPGTNAILGVRLPLLRQTARTIAKDDWRSFLETATDDSFEEIMLQGMVIGYVDCPLDERFRHIQTFVPKIDNWSVCDSFCTGLKFTRDNRSEVWAFIAPYFKSADAYALRFAVVMFLTYFINDQYREDGLAILDGVCHDGYYVKMAVAWAVSICFIKFPEPTMAWLKENKLDDFTYNKSLQKITESLKVDKKTKDLIRRMKRI